MAHSRGFGSRRTGSVSLRRQTAWAIGPGGTTPVNITSSVAVILGGTVVPASEGLTVIRTRGLFAMHLKSVASQNDGFQGAIGIGLATLAAVTAGVGSLPTPLTEVGDENWLYHRFISIHAQEATESNLNGASWTRFEIDSKAMRKVPVGTSCYACLEVIEVGTASAQAFLDTRQLVKLP